MSFRINTNTQAMGALRNLGLTSAEMQKSMTRLSTGLRINSAADDPAGLIVSEQFRAQITGIDQAVRNNQDATNYAKTAEGALNEVNKLLNDARALAVASGNGATLTDSQRQANQQQLNSIVNSINRISSQTSFGNKKLLDGSSGVTATSTGQANVRAMNLSGNFGGNSITGASTVTIAVTTAATRASATGTGLVTAANNMSAAGSATLNGVSFTWSTSDTAADVVGRMNQASDQTGVTARITAGNVLELTSRGFGTDAKVNFVDSSGVFGFTGNTVNAAGTNAVADVTIDTNGTATGGLTTVTFNAGSGLTLRDNSGNTIQLTEAYGSATSVAAARGQVTVGSASFQIGANSGETATLSIGNFAASNLGRNTVSGLDLSNLSFLTDSGASDALKVIDSAISEVSSARGQIGNFIRNTLESNVRSLGVQRENLSASESAIRDIDVANEMTNYTKLQILQQSGISMLAQANSAPQSVLSLLR